MRRRECIYGTATLAALVGTSGCGLFGAQPSETLTQHSAVGRGNWPMARAAPHNSGGIAAELDWDALTLETVMSAADTDGRRVTTLTYADGSLVAVVGDRTVLVWDVEQGAPIWRQATDRAVTTAPAIANESVYVSTESRVRPYRLSSGAVPWSVEVTSLDVPLLPANGRLVIEDKPASTLLGLAATSGEQSWVYEVDLSPRGVARASNRVFVTQRGEDIGVVTALAVETGEEMWRREFDPIDISPTVAGDSVLVGTKAGTLLSLRQTDGQTVWETQPLTAREGHFMPLAADDNTVYVPPNNGKDIVAMSLADGMERWRVTTGQSDLSVTLTKHAVLHPRRDRLAVYRKAPHPSELRSFSFRTNVLAVCPTAVGIFVATETRVYLLG